MTSDIRAGNHHALGATIQGDGVNFCVFSKNCWQLDLLFFDHVDAARPARVITLQPQRNRTFYYWHVWVKGVQAGQLYAYRAYGAHAPEEGHRFDGSKVLLDPYGRAVAVGAHYDRALAGRYGVDNTREALKSVVVDLSAYDWEDDKPLNLPYANSFIYEMHVSGFTKHPSSSVDAAKRGTYAGLIEKIPYLKSLGVTTVELMPICQFDPDDAPSGRVNYWGYSPIGFFAPHLQYAAARDPLGAVDEFRDMVKALHKAGIEVVLDVVFNHSAEGDENGPTLSFRGLENRAYYILAENRAYYANYSGCGNTLNANHSIVRRMIMDALRYWVAEMHVDGFRFDLASSMARDEWGTPLKSPPIVWEIDSEPILAGAKIIAEAWDAGGLYQVGRFIGDRWAEWNGVFRDDVRRFIKGDVGMAGAFARRLTASSDLYATVRDPNRAINFVTCHDGFTLNDLVSYNRKHNEANGEGNRDGHNDNHSWNCGVEGDTDDPDVLALRSRQVRNFLLAVFIAQGTPMLLMGDEVRRTQRGNNNAYCQDNELSWFDWALVEREQELLAFVRDVVDFTHRYQAFDEERFWGHGSATAITWHGHKLHEPDWSENAHHVAFTLVGADVSLYVAFNAHWQDARFELPKGDWRALVYTAEAHPPNAKLYRQHITLMARSAVVLRLEA